MEVIGGVVSHSVYTGMAKPSIVVGETVVHIWYYQLLNVAGCPRNDGILVRNAFTRFFG